MSQPEDGEMMPFKAVGPLPWCQGKGSEVAVGSAGQRLGVPGACVSWHVWMDKLPKPTSSSLALGF